MPQADIIDLTISLESRPIPRAGFGIPLMIADFDAAVDTAFGADLVKEVTPSTWKTVLTGLGLTTSDSEYLNVAAYFGDDERQPALVLVGRRATPVAQVDNVSIDTAEAGTYTITINGTDFTFVAAAETATQIRDALVTAVNGGTEPVTAGNGAGDTLDLTADVAGQSFTVAVDHSVTPANISTSSTTPNTGPQDDLAAIKAVRDDFYFIQLHERTDGLMEEVSAWTETERKICFLQTSDSTAQDATTTDLGATLNALGRVRSAVVFHPTDTEYADARIIGRMAPSTPGSETWAHQEIKGIVGITPTSSTNLSSKGYNWLEFFTAGSFTMTAGGFVGGIGYGGTVADRTFIDLVRGRDWLFNEIAIAKLELLRNEPKIPYNSDGGQQLDACLSGVLENAVGVGLLNDYTTTIPVPEDESATNKGNRYLPGVLFDGELQGAIHALKITGVLAP